MITPTIAQNRINESLVGFPPRVTEAYRAFAEGGDLASLDVAVLGVLHFYLAKKPKEPLDALPGTTRLVEDLGGDSLTMMDTVFMVESLLDIKIDDTELARLATLDELRAYIRQQVKNAATSAA
jgi:acyl carrier protein